MVGKAVSAHHAWIVGAIDSTQTAIASWHLANNNEGAFAAFKHKLERVQGGLPGEMDETVLYHKAKLGDKSKRFKIKPTPSTSG